MNKDRKLSENQVKIMIDNICKLRHLTNIKQVFKGKPKWTKEVLTKYGYENFGKFAENYTVLLANGVDKDKNECFIIVETGSSFEKYTIFACKNLLHLFIEHINININRPLVSICFMSDIANRQLIELNSPIFNFPYRFIILPDLYYCCGSKTKIGGLTSDFEIHPYQEAYNKKDYALINSNDPMIIALNGLPNELYIYSELKTDHGAYKKIYIKKIQKIAKDSKAPINSLCEDFIFNVL